MSMNAPPTHMMHPSAGHGAAQAAEAFAKKHLLLLAGLLAGIVVLFLFLRQRASAGRGDGGVMQYPDNTASGLPTPGGAASGSPINTGSDGSGQTTSPGDVFGSFLQGFALGQSSISSAGPTDSSGESTPIDTSGGTSTVVATTLAARVSPVTTLAATGAAKTQPRRKGETTHPHPGAQVHGNITTQTHPATRVGQSRAPRPAGTTAVGRHITSTLPRAQQLINGLAPHDVARSSHRQTSTPIVPLQHNKATGTHATGAIAPVKRAPLSTAHTTIKKASQQKGAPARNTIPHIHPVAAHAVPRQTPISKSAQISKPLLSAPLHPTNPIQATVDLKNTLLGKFTPKTLHHEVKKSKKRPAAKKKK